jgi:carbonic anhydrase
MLKVFQDPREAVKAEISSLRQEPFIPDDLIVHGLLYDLATGRGVPVVMEPKMKKSS